MINEIYRRKGYQSIDSDNNNDSDLNPKIKQYFIYLVLFLIVIIIVRIFIRSIRSERSDIKEKMVSSQQSQYQFQVKGNNDDNIFPKINSIDNIGISDINQLFQSRRLFINDKNITQKYISIIRPINKIEEEKYKQKLYPNKLFNDYSPVPREGQLNLNEFYEFCNRQRLILSNKIQASENPTISIIISLLFRKNEIIRSINSIQSQSYKNIEIIIVDDTGDNSMNGILKYILDNEPRARLFIHSKSMGLWRSRLDGFLYSKGQYILHVDPGDILSDSFILEEIYNLVKKYSLDTIRFSFSKTKYNYFLNTKKFKEMKIFPSKFTQIIYGKPDYDVHEYGFGTIWNRLIRANIITKGLDLVDEYIYNANKNLWEDMWWNDLVDRVSYSNLVINRLGYIFLYDRNSVDEPKLGNEIQKDKTIREFIYFWLFDYQLLQKNNNKKKIINTLRNYSRRNNTFCRLPLSLDFLTSNSPVLEHLLILLYNDQYVSDNDKQLIKELYSKYKNINKKK